MFKNWIFLPKRIAMFFHPFYIIRRNLFLAIKDEAQHVHGTLLDFGCGQKPYKDLFPNVNSYIGVDIEISGHDHENSQVDIFYDGKKIPFDDNTFDCIFASEVLEHVPNNHEILSEFYRVLKPHGKVIITVPFFWGEHEQPFDYIRLTKYGISNILSQKGFTNIHIKRLGGNIESIFQILTAHIIELVPKKRIFQLLILPVIVPLNILGRLISKVPIHQTTIYLNTITVANKGAL
jgi:SAM-dependent methyltransferase